MNTKASLAILAPLAFITPASAATATSTLAVSATVAYPCTISAARLAGPVCQAASAPSMAVPSPHAIRTLRRDATTGVTTLTIEF